MPRSALERFAEAESGVADGDHDDAAAEALGPAIALHGDPATLAGVLDDVLADLGQRHREADDRLRLELELRLDDLLRALLHAADDAVDVVGLRDGRDVE